MATPKDRLADRVPLSRSQRNLYNGVLQDNDPALYLIGKRYRFHPLEPSRFLAALKASILGNPVQLCVLQGPSAGLDYPELVLRLQFDDIVHVCPATRHQDDPGGDGLIRAWSSGILAKPLVRYTVWTGERGHVSGLDVYTHHILLDGGATGMIEADLARYLDDAAEIPCITADLSKLANAHRREAARVDESLARLADVVQRELANDAHRGAPAPGRGDAPGGAARGRLCDSARVSGHAYDVLLALSERAHVPLNALVATAAVAVDSSVRQSTETLLVHAVDNRFGDPDLHVATCLVNSIAHSVRFPPFASVGDVVRMLDRGYVKAVRRRWLREEHYRRMYLAVNRTPHVQALTLNFIRESCAPGLRPFLTEAPVATDIGPVEGMTVACVLDEDRRTLDLAIWDRADLPERERPTKVADRIAAALESMPELWGQPIAMAVGEWLEVTAEGSRCQGNTVINSDPTGMRAWFLDPAGAVQKFLERRRYVDQWVGWLVSNNAVPGDVVVFADDNTDKTIDLLVACHLAGCGYSVCDSVDEVDARAHAIAAHGEGISAHKVDVAAAHLAPAPEAELRQLVRLRVEQVTQDAALASNTAYVMPTSGSTGQPKLVRISHGSLAFFCDAVRVAYGWATSDTLLQCAPLTSDISVEEIFGSAICGAELIRSTAMRSGDLDTLVAEVGTKGPTVLDLPSAVWHLLCEDDDAIDPLRHSRLRQIVIGGEPVRPSAVDKWTRSAAAQQISVVSSYGPTETTVVVSYLPIVGNGWSVSANAGRRLGRPVAPNTVFVAFGEVVIAGDLVSAGYLGRDDSSFGTVTASDGSRRRVFATADRVTVDNDGFFVFSGRRDAIVKISGKRVDTAALVRRIHEEPTISDVAVEPHDGSLAVWFETLRTREGAEDEPAQARIKRILVGSQVPSFSVVGVPHIPRKPNGKIDSANLPTLPRLADAAESDAESTELARGLAEVWSRHLGRVIRPEASLLAEGIGSLDLIRILPDTRRYLGHNLSILDLISADSASALAGNLGLAMSGADAWMDVDAAAEIARDLAAISHRRPAIALHATARRQTILVLGASGILGTGFAQALLELRQSGLRCPEVVLATRSQLPERDPWTALRRFDGVRIERLPAEFGAAELDVLIRDTGARTVVNCIGNTNVLVPYRELRLANVQLVSAIAEACARRATRLVHLSTYVVNADVTVPRVTAPGAAPYPYAASKSLAELVIAGWGADLDFTITRLPRVLGEGYQLPDSADILVSVVDACIALRACPVLHLTEGVTTGRAAAKAILRGMPGLVESAEPGGGITVVRGAAVNYRDLLRGYSLEEITALDWKHRLDQSDWARRHPRRWSVVDGWFSLGMKLGDRSYAEYLADYPTIALGVESVTELTAPPRSVRALLAHGLSR
ncbi:Plipastatin synthase subunit C [Mycobacterium basiliense]|uniref:Plipastatin synthase subunit C n=1 Tax=Mycobacterium basiliense TaxID=2094119 RepID=A0A447G861_9MYCO|nr:AMP-binding protein [Mycobacterium basiliense]VDM86667.1 Plipastatin synthase subunit C [Mycobacterium basiliense]